MSNYQKFKFVMIILSSNLFGDIEILGIGFAVLTISLAGVESLFELILGIKNGKINGVLQRVLICSGIIVSCIVVAILVNIESIENISGCIRRWIYICCCVVICSSVALNAKENDIEFICNIYVITTTISAIFVICQYFDISWAWNVARMSEEDMLGLTSHQRFSGLSPSVILFAYQCSGTLAYLILRGVGENNKLGWSILLIVNSIALALNRTRSAFVAVFFIIVIYILFSTKKKRIMTWLIILTFVVLLCADALNFNMYDISDYLSHIMRSVELKDAGTVARIPMFLTAFNHALRNPFGMGEYHPDTNLIVGAMSIRIRNLVSSMGSHNLFANCAVNYGFIALCTMVVLYKKIYTYFKRNRDRSRKLIKYHGISEIKIYAKQNEGVFGIIVVSLINACFHNCYILAEDVMSWICFGMIVSISTRLGKIYQKYETPYKNERNM